MSQETRTIRPFAGLGSVQDVFVGTVLEFGDLQCLADSSLSVELDPHEFLQRRVLLRWADPLRIGEFKGQLVKACEDIEADPCDVSILVVATTPYLKKADVVFELPVSDVEALEPVVDLSDSDRPRALRAPHHGFRIDAYLVLTKDLPQRPLKPWRKGTWLARSFFRVTTEAGRSMFTPVPLDAETRKRLRLPAQTMSYVDLGDHDPLEPYDDQAEKPVLYVDADLLAELSASANSAAGVALQLQLAQGFMERVIFETSRREELRSLSIEDVEGTLLGRILRVAAGSKATSDVRQTILGLVRSEPSRVVAMIEHAVGIQRAFLKAMHGEQS